MLSKISSRLWLASLVVLLDQLSKYWIYQQLIFNEPYEITSFFNLYLGTNQGAAFSMLSEHPQLAFWIFSGLAFSVSVGMIVWLLRGSSAKLHVLTAFNLILGGALGNLIDRIRLGHVVDFIQLHYGSYYWPIFNLADSAIFVGAVILVFDAIFVKEKNNEHSVS